MSGGFWEQQDNQEAFAERIDRFVLAFERIASALEGINGTGSTVTSKLWPAPAGQRESVVTKAESEEERARKEQGKLVPKTDLNQWLSEEFGGEEEPVGERELEFLERQRKQQSSSSQADGFSGPEGGGDQETQVEAGSVGEGPATS